MIFDTNVLIYLSKNILKIEHLIKPETKPAISVISYIEAKGFRFDTQEAEDYMYGICSSCITLPITNEIIDECILLRKSNKIKLPDAIIYSTALVHQLPLLTNNIADFKSLGGKVELIDPFTL